MKWKDSEEAVETVTEEGGAFEEAYSPLRTHKPNVVSRVTSVFTHPGSWVVVILLVLLVILILSLRPGGGEKALLSAVDQRIQQLENRLAALEGIGEVVSDLENNQQTTQPLMARLDRLETSFANRVNEVDQKLKKLEAKPVATGAKQNSAPVAGSNTTKDSAQTHVVKKGETLYGISKQYGLSLTQLMNLNKLSKGTVISPGQTLKIQ